MPMRLGYPLYSRITGVYIDSVPTITRKASFVIVFSECRAARATGKPLPATTTFIDVGDAAALPPFPWSPRRLVGVEEVAFFWQFSCFAKFDWKARLKRSVRVRN